jgi:DNA repair exonuclease SbcCD ATPase subunit
MNTKLIEFFKKALAFMQKNWIAVAIIATLLIFSGGLNSCANKKLAKKDATIAEKNKNISDLQKQLKDKEAAYTKLDNEKKEINKHLEDLQKDKEKIEKDKLKIDQKYATLLKKFGQLSVDEQDKLLIDLLKKYNIRAEVRDNMLVITMEDRGKLYTFVVDIDKVKEQLKNSEEALVNCKATVTEKEGLIANAETTITLKNDDIAKLNQIIVDKDIIIKNQKDKIFWTKVSSFTKKAIPALIIGLVVGFLVAK